ncbi:hypothetical protein D3C87_1932430 [compost metagenome]
MSIVNSCPDFISALNRPYEGSVFIVDDISAGLIVPVHCLVSQNRVRNWRSSDSLTEPRTASSGFQ